MIQVKDKEVFTGAAQQTFQSEQGRSADVLDKGGEEWINSEVLFQPREGRRSRAQLSKQCRKGPALGNTAAPS